MALCFSNPNPMSVIDPQVLPLITVAVDVECFDNDEVQIPPSAAGVYRYFLFVSDKAFHKKPGDCRSRPITCDPESVCLCVKICVYICTYSHIIFLNLCICTY